MEKSNSKNTEVSTQIMSYCNSIPSSINDEGSQTK